MAEKIKKTQTFWQIVEDMHREEVESDPEMQETKKRQEERRRRLRGTKNEQQPTKKAL